jgi:hypothetical protein
MKWQRYLLANGWLKLTGGCAADKYDKPTRGASKVPIMRVDDPLKGCLAEKISHEEGGGIIQPEGGGNITGGKIPPKVSGYGSGSSSRCVTAPTTTIAIAMTSSLRSDAKRKNQKQNPEQKQNQKQNPQRSPSEVKLQLKQSPKYDSLFPAEFNAWSVQARAEWVEAHSRAKAESRVGISIPVGKKEPLPVERMPVIPVPGVKPPKTPPPPRRCRCRWSPNGGWRR